MSCICRCYYSTIHNTVPWTYYFSNLCYGPIYIYMYILLLFDIVYLYFVLVISNFVYNAVYKAIFYVQTHTTKLNKHKIK